MDSSKKQPNWPLLAGARFVLALIVVLSHMRGYPGFKLATFADFIGSLGCVMAFFMISGYSIAHSISQRPEKFLIRRFWRIWPTYLFSFFALTLPAAFLCMNVKTSQAVGNMFLLQGILVPVLESNSAAWSLAIEELLYLLSPIFRRTPTKVLLILIGFSSTLYAFSAPLGITRFAGEIGGRGVVCCAWAWLLGFVYYRHMDKKWALHALVFLPVLLMGASNQLLGELQCAVVLATAQLLIYSPEIKPLSKITADTLSWLGNVSYPLYLCHMPLLFLLHLWKFAKDKPFVYLVVAGALSMLVYHFIDAPNRCRLNNTLPCWLESMVRWFMRKFASIFPASA